MLFAITLGSGCSTTKFTPYKESDIIQGKGGEVENIDGIDFWSDGDPDRQYRIIGEIEESRNKAPLPGQLNRLFSNNGKGKSTMAKSARKYGGNAVIIVRRQASDWDQDEGGHHQRSKKFIIIKYVDESKSGNGAH